MLPVFAVYSVFAGTKYILSIFCEIKGKKSDICLEIVKFIPDCTLSVN